ncbi:MAG: hypothetical protein ACFE75_08670 [Candidatus Hodarchaeota archaeon]
MNEKEKEFKKIELKENYELNMTEFYKALNKAINSNNEQSIYGLSKIFTRYCFKELDN